MSDDEFLQAVGEHMDLVYNLARRLTRSGPHAEDLVQETYLRALRGWRRRPPDDVRAWLATICLNTARAGYRRDAARPAEVLAPDAGATLVSAHDTAAEAITAAVRGQVHQALWATTCRAAGGDHPDGPVRLHGGRGRRDDRHTTRHDTGPGAPGSQASGGAAGATGGDTR